MIYSHCISNTMLQSSIASLTKAWTLLVCLHSHSLCSLIDCLLAVFHEILTKLAPNWDESFLNMELLFEGFDSRGDRVLDFEELINGLNVLFYGDAEAKLRRAHPALKYAQCF